jgi:serine/threonine protein kinase/tetratricopeptide (TPR) repeat protein
VTLPDEAWPRVKDVFAGARALALDARPAYLAAACGGDEALRQEVEMLLASHARAGSFLEMPAVLFDDTRSTKSLEGQRLGGYQLSARIGTGGMGEVYRARDPKLNRDVAIKVLLPAVANDPGRLARFSREAQLLASLNHPHICTIHDVGKENSTAYLVMELLEGRTLDRWIPRDGVAVAQFFDIAIALADALSAAHRKHITHRDLKPVNVMVSDEGHVKVLDFGLAQTAEPEPGLTRAAHTQAGTIVGTMPYMSPEQIEAKPLDSRTDIFSLGIVLYEMATGRRPFEGDSTPALMVSILKGEPTRVGELRPDVPADVSRLIGRCLEKRPCDRIQTVAEALAELKAHRRAWELGPATSSTPLAPGRVVPGPERVASIAVLAFTDMSAAKDQEWFCDGIAEEILNALTPLEGLRVAARTSAFSFKGTSIDLRTIGETLNVTTVLEGSVRRAGDRVRITVQLSDVANGFQLWSERYDRELKDIFDVQDEIAKAIAERLRVTLAGGKDDRLVEQGTTNVEAYQLYLKGRALLDRRGAGVPAALDLLRSAVALDPGYSLAWAGVADAFTVLAYSGVVRGSESKAHAMAAATRSIELAPTSAAGHTALACATLLYENNRSRAKQEFERALALNPRYGLGRCWYALHYFQWACGDYEQGIAEARRALECDPLSAYVMMILGACLFTAGRVDEAIATCRRAVQQDAESFVAHWALGISLGMARRFDEAVSTLESAAVMSGRFPLALTALAGVLGQSGKAAEARTLHHELIDRASRGYVAASHLALTAEACGEHEAAMAFARRAWDEREPPFILWARHFPHYRALHSDPRFVAILREMNESV